MKKEILIHMYNLTECKVLTFVHVIIVRIVKVETKWSPIFYMGYAFLPGLDHDKNIILCKFVYIVHASLFL